MIGQNDDKNNKIVSFTQITATMPKVLSKSFTLSAEGELVKKSGGQLVDGIAETVETDVNGFADLLGRLGPHEALTFGVCGYKRARVVKEEMRPQTPPGDLPVISRTQTYLQWPNGPGVLMIDYDPPKDGPPLPREALLEILYGVIPGLREAPHVWAASASSCIYRTETGEVDRDVMGQRVYMFVSDASDIGRAGDVLDKRLWLAGHGRIELSSSGAMLERSIVDAAVWQPERLDFAGGAHCGPGLEQRRPAPMVFNPDGDFIDTRTALPDLTADEEREFKRLVTTTKQAKKPEADAKRKVWVDARVQEGLARLPETERKTAEPRIRETYEAAAGSGVLGAEFVLYPDGGDTVTVGQVLNDPDRWDGKRFADPLEPDYGNDARIAVLNLRGEGGPYLYSHAHGGTRYALRRERPTVRLHGGELHNVMDQMLVAIRIDGVIYERGDELVRIADSRIVPVTHGWLCKYLTELIQFLKFDSRGKDGGQFKPVDCPDKLASKLLDLRGSWGFPRLKKIITAPVITVAGRIIEEPGLDRETGLYLTTVEGWEPLPQNLTDEDYRAFAATALEPFQEFPFDGPVSRGGMVAAVLMAVMRPTLDTAPAVVVTASSFGSGKTLVSKSLARISGGQSSVMAYTPDEDEMEKRLLSYAREGVDVVIFDNIDGAVLSRKLAMILTTEWFQGRVLGKTGTITVPTGFMCILNGNNITLEKDMARRGITIRLNPECERPWEREFDFDPDEFVQKNRMKIIRAALALLKADKGTRRGKKLASFENWSMAVNETVLWIRDNSWLDIDDPVESLRTATDEDPERLKLGELLDVWREEFGPTGGTANDAIDLAKSHGHKHLTTILTSICGEGHGEFNSRILGRWIPGRKGKIIDGFRFRENGKVHGAVRWVAERVANSHNSHQTTPETPPKISNYSSALSDSGEIGEFNLTPIIKVSDKANDTLYGVGENNSPNSHISPFPTEPENRRYTL